MLRPPFVWSTRLITQALRTRPADANHSEWTAYLDGPADLWQNLPGPPVLQPGLQPGLQMSNSL